MDTPRHALIKALTGSDDEIVEHWQHWQASTDTEPDPITHRTFPLLYRRLRSAAVDANRTRAAKIILRP